MLIKNEISFGGFTAHQNYALLVMIILYVLSLLACTLLVIVLLKLIVTCVFTDKFNYLFGVRTDSQKVCIPSDSSPNTSVKSSPKIFRFDDFFVKLTESQFETKRHCVCPICANGHMSMASMASRDVNYAIDGNCATTPTRKVPKRSSFISRRAQTLSQTLILKKELTIDNNNEKPMDNKESDNPIVSQSSAERIVLRAGDRPMPQMKQIANYSDVVHELKQKFSSMSVINSLV